MRSRTVAFGFILALLGAGTGFRAQDQTEAQKKAAQAQAREAQREALELQKKALEAQKEALQDQKKEIQKQVIILERRARLGLVLRTDREESSDAKGAYVEAVTPGGPAADAGLKAGDIITTFNGEPLPGKYPGADEDESEPAVKLMDMARKLKSGDKVTLGYLRGKETRTATLTARELGPLTWTGEMPEIPEIPDMSGLDDYELDLENIPELRWLGRAEGWMDMEMVPMNADLAPYFGTSEGVLVVRAPSGSALKLKGGDVIEKIGERTPKSGSQVFRILRSYEPGDTVNFEVLRMHKKTSLSFEIPKEDRTRHERFRFSPSEGPLPPAAPSPPTAPTPRPSTGA